MARVKVGVVQLCIRPGRPEQNLSRAEQLVARAVEGGARLVVLPEAFSGGLDLPRSGELAEPIPGPQTERLGRLARSCGAWIAAGIIERRGPGVASAAVLIDEDGEVRHVHRRVFVYSLERHFLEPGGEIGVVETPLGRIGVALGYDVQFPEATRPLFLLGAEIMICPALLLRPFAPSVRSMILARAAENACYVLFASACGENTLASLTFLGQSAILQGPIGLRSFCNEFRKQPPVLAEAGEDEAVLLADLDLDALRRLQAIHPLRGDLLSHPRPEPARWWPDLHPATCVTRANDR